MRLIEPFGAGGGPDLLGRALAQKLTGLWGQPVTVENVPGAGATVGPAQVAKSPADGYTLLVNTSAQAYSAALLKNLPYDPLKDFIPVAPLTSQANGQTIRTIAREADVRQERALPEWNRCNQRLTETRVSNITHYGIGHFQRRNLARDTFLAVTHVPHPFAA